MSVSHQQTSTPLETPSYGPLLFLINAVVAWCAVVLSFTLNLTGYYVDSLDPSKPTILGNTAAGVATPLERFFDWTTYFTILSNVVVAVVMTVLVVRPALFTRQDKVGTLWRTLRLDSLLMIVVTGVVYNLLLAGGAKTGWDALNNTMLHWVVPLLTPIVWILAGPRGLIRLRTIALSLVLPLLWATYALVRGQAVGAYPYSFLDVSANGLASVITFVAAILVVAVILAFVLWAIDIGLRWTARPAPELADEPSDA
jgi:hypothetical protein